ncbi:MAG TPA: hypothetical protein VGJ60_20425 [Chloroflexota bacterium]|jgi:hypothetical protein
MMNGNTSTYAWPNVQPGQVEEVIIGDLPMQLVPGKYVIQEADRFGEKVSQGDLKYSDFNPYESSQSSSTLVSGAGLQRYTDVQDPTTVNSYYKESSNVSCIAMPAVLSPEMLQQTLPSAISAPVWMGELITADGVRHMLAVGPRAVWERATGGAWTKKLDLPADPLQNAVSVFRNTLIIGYGSFHTGQATDNLTALVDVTGNSTVASGPDIGPIYIYATTGDHATSYVAGSNNGDPTIVLASLDPDQGYVTPTQTGTGAIRSLAPGGGIALLFVGKETELGEIDQAGLYRTLIPFDGAYSGNCQPLKWYLSSGADAQRGPTVLVFPRGHGLWLYAPSTITAGDSYNISPWSQPWLRPPNARGAITAIQGSSRWLYFAVRRTSDGHTWIYRRDAATGASHTWLDLGVGNCYTMAITTLVPTSPGNSVLLIGYGNSVLTVQLPLDGDIEQDDTGVRHQLIGYLDLPETELGFPDEDKIPISVRLSGSKLAPNQRWFEVDYSIDEGPWTRLGTVNAPLPQSELMFPRNLVFRRLAVRVWFHSSDGSESPELFSVSIRMSLNPKLYRLFIVQCTVPTASFDTLADNLQNPYLLMQNLWNARRAGFPVTYSDPWNDQFLVRILKMQQTQMLRQPELVPETTLDFTLLEVIKGRTALDFLYDTVEPDGPLDNALYGYDRPLSQYDTVGGQ